MNGGAAIRNPNSESTSTDLINRVIEGDQQAWTEFVELYSALIYSRCRAASLSPHDSADVTQEVFRRIYRTIPNFRRDEPGQGFRRWLRTIAANVIVDHFREQNRHPAAFGGTTIGEWLAAIPDPFSESSDSAQSSDQSSSAFRLHKALNSIRIDYENTTWQAFWLTVVEGRLPVDVAEELGMTTGSVRQAKYKILRRLRMELEGLI